MNQPLIIQITNPCHENWNEMSEVEQGKFCSHCQKTVIDFSMKTDAELLEYFTHHTSFCGRFRNNQLDRIIEVPKPTVKRLFDFYSKAAALFFTVFSFNSYQTKAQSPHSKIENFVQRTDEIHPGKISIEGTITDDENRFIDSATIFFDNVKVATSNHVGYYKFEIENMAVKNHIVSFDKKNLIHNAISFNPLMENRIVDVVLKTYKGRLYSHTMGMPSPPRVKAILIKNVSIKTNLFKNLQVVNFVNAIINWSKWNPSFKIAINLNYSVDAERKIYLRKGNEILEHLAKSVDKERLQLRVTKNPQKANMIEVVDYTED